MRMMSILAAMGLACQPPAERLPPVPTAAQAAWHDLEVGMFIHLAPQTWQDSESDDLSVTPAQMNPAQLDTDQWVAVAQSMGARYIVFVAKHEGGFCWWQTDTTDFSVRHSPWREGKGDVLADLSESCRKRGMQLGVYISPQDRKHGVGIGGKAKDPGNQKPYEALFRRQLTEVLSRYGDMMEVWFDGSLVFDVGDILKAHAPNAVVFQGPQASIRWVGNEDGVCPEGAWNTVKFGVKTWGDYTAADSDPSGDRWLPIECDARLRSTWFWNTTGESTIKSVEALMAMYEASVGRGAVLLLNNTPDRTGRIPEPDAKRCAEFGEAVRSRYEHRVAFVAGRGVEHAVTLTPSPSVTHIVVKEDIREGERIRRYVIEGRGESVGPEWKVLASGTAVGHRRNHAIQAAGVSQIRLRVTESVAEPNFSLKAYRSPGATP